MRTKMAKKKEAVPAGDEPKRPDLIPVRLGLTADQHYSLRLAAAHEKMSMSEFVRSVLLPVLGYDPETGERVGAPVPGQGGPGR